jgi:hypothetical protein
VRRHRDALPPLDHPLAEAARGGDHELGAVVAEERDHPGARLCGRDAGGQDGVEHLRRGQRARERLGGELQSPRVSRRRLGAFPRLDRLGVFGSSAPLEEPGERRACSSAA